MKQFLKKNAKIWIPAVIILAAAGFFLAPLHRAFDVLVPSAAVFLLADQPQIPAELVRMLVDTHAATLSPLVAPRVNGRRANPVLFGILTFPDLLALSGDTGGRLLFTEPTHYPIAWVDWPDDRILLDVDTLDDYNHLLGIYQT